MSAGISTGLVEFAFRSIAFVAFGEVVSGVKMVQSATVGHLHDGAHHLLSDAQKR